MKDLPFSDIIQALQEKHDLRVVQGSPSSPKVLRDAGAADADLMVAVTASDEINMVACQMGYTLFNTPIRIARIRNSEYLREKDKLFNDENVPIDHLISPENLVTDEITRLIAYPGALQVAYFANNRISMVVVRAYYGGPLVGYALSAFREHMPPHRNYSCNLLFLQCLSYIRPSFQMPLSYWNFLTCCPIPFLNN